MPVKKVQVPGVKGGGDSLGNTYDSTNEMWEAELGRAEPTSEEGWYGTDSHSNRDGSFVVVTCDLHQSGTAPLLDVLLCSQDEPDSQ